MKNVIRLFFIVIVVFIVGYFALLYISSLFGWYGYKKWTYRVATSDINESKRRNVFVKELHFQIDSFTGKISDFRPYIEKGFKYGLHSSKETVPLMETNFPYQLSFNFQPTEKINIMMNKTELNKFDSSNIIRGYLTHPNLKDTIYIQIIGENIHTGVIKVWQ